VKQIDFVAALGGPSASISGLLRYGSNYNCPLFFGEWRATLLQSG